MLQSEHKPLAQAFLASTSLGLFAATSVPIRIVAAHHPAAALPWVIGPTILRDYRWFPISDFALVLGVLVCIVACRLCSHVLAAAAVLLATALVYCDTLRVWTWEPKWPVQLGIAESRMLS